MAFDGMNITTVEDLKREVNHRRIGETTQLTIMHGLRRGIADLKIEGRP